MIDIKPYDNSFKPTVEDLLQCCVSMQDFPSKLAKALKNVNEDMLNKTLKNGSWSLEKIIHHIADANMNTFIRIKRMIALDGNTITPWNQDLWAKDSDYNYNFESSYAILLGLMQRMSLLCLDILKDAKKLTIEFYHPEHKEQVSLSNVIYWNNYHNTHHLNQILTLVS